MNINEYFNFNFFKNYKNQPSNDNNNNSLSMKFSKVLDVPGIGYFKSKIYDNLENSRITLVFIDSADKKSLTEASEFLYDIINNDAFNDTLDLIVVCNKSDGKFAKGKNVIESELNNEIDSKKLIKQKNNLEDQSDQLGKLFVSKYLKIFLIMQ